MDMVATALIAVDWNLAFYWGGVSDADVSIFHALTQHLKMPQFDYVVP